MLAIFAVIIGGIVTGRLLVGWRLAFVQRLITFIIWALLFLLGVEVGSDPSALWRRSGRPPLRSSRCPLRGASSLRGCCGGVFAAALCLRTKAEMRTKLPFPRGRP